MRTGLSQPRTMRPRLGFSQTQLRFLLAALALAALFVASVPFASRWSVTYTAVTPDGSFALPPKPMRARLRVVTLCLTPFSVTVFVVVVVTPNVRFGGGEV